MLVACIVLLVLGAVAIFFLNKEKIKAYTVKETLIKTAASILFISIAIVSLYHSGLHNITPLIISGLVFGLLGDIFLELKYVFPNESRLFTYAGFIVFALGHICYISGMIWEFYIAGQPLYIILPLVGGLIGTIGNLLLEKPMKLKFGEYKIIVTIYAFFLFCTLSMALSLAIQHSFAVTSLNMLIAGGAFFVISDLILSGTYFGENKERPVDIISNMVTYYIAQYVIAFSIFFL